MTTSIKGTNKGIFLEGEMLGKMDLTPEDESVTKIKLTVFDGTVIHAIKVPAFWQLCVTKHGNLYEFANGYPAENPDEAFTEVCFRDGVEAIASAPLKEE